ncbi:MAG: DUF2911 domain-containing protein [Cyclobacteriaceae bacterium]|nr:DUF2911 domain-containing protein [Cyclobacteriaceae bacterium]
MKKKVLISVAIVILVLVGALIYLNNRNRTLSPPGSAQLSNGTLTVTVQYSRPSVRNRVIFGTKEEGALQPYGEYWRLGANEATEITFNRSVSFNGSEVAKGTYRMYAIPGADAFELALNSELGVWGVFEPDQEKDVLKTTVPVEKLSTPVEQYTIRMDAVGDTTNVYFEWEKVRLTVPVVGK